MKKILFTCLILISLSARTYALSGGIQFHSGSLQEVLNQAESEQKLIFVDAYADWCGPCRYMSSHVFTDPEVGDLFNRYFVNYKLDMETEEGEWFDLRYRIDAYPPYLFWTKKGTLSPERWVLWMQLNSWHLPVAIFAISFKM